MTLTPSVVSDVPLWTSDDPSNWNAAFSYHKPWARPGPDGYLTLLVSSDEAAFQTWVNTYNVPVDIASLISNYDYRGYWFDQIRGTSAGYTQGSRLTDYWLTPYSTMFSAKSFYAKDHCPYHWHGDKLIDESTNTLLFWAQYGPQDRSAVDYIEKSKVDPRAAKKGLMGDDLDMEAVRLYIAGKLKLKLDDQILDADTIRTIEGASTLTLELLDDDREVLRSGLLSSALDMEIDGLWWRLTRVEKSGDTLRLEFETREIAWLRLANDVIPPTKRTDTLTRARFILRLIRESKVRIPVFIPSINEKQPTNDASASGKGIPNDLPANDDPLDIIFDPRRGLTVKGKKATKEQINNVNTILGEAEGLSAPRKVMVCAIMTGIMESQILNLGGKIDSEGHKVQVGVFQQNDRYWPASNNVAIDAAAFLKAAIIENRKYPNLSYNDLCWHVQRPEPEARDDYGQYKGEAENWVTAYLNEPPDDGKKNIADRNTSGAGSSMGGKDAGGGTRASTGGTARDGKNDNAYWFYRGIPGNNDQDWEKEDSWTCIQRLAGDVNWRAFFVGGTFWYVDDDFLFSQKPLMTITESSVGIDIIDFDYDSRKKMGTITLKARIGRWVAPPGAVVVVQNMGPVNGKWLVNEFSRSLFDLTATIILKKPLPDLKESSVSNNPPGTSTNQDSGSAASSNTTDDTGKSVFGSDIVIPIIATSTHETSGLSGYPAVDFIMDKDGNTVSGAGPNAMGQSVSFEEGGVVRDVHLITWKDGYGGITFYMKGDSGADYFVTHLDDSSPVTAGPIKSGEIIGYLTKNPIHSKWINGAHVHVGSTKYTPRIPSGSALPRLDRA